MANIDQDPSQDNPQAGDSVGAEDESSDSIDQSDIDSLLDRVAESLEEPKAPAVQDDSVSEEPASESEGTLNEQTDQVIESAAPAQAKTKTKGNLQQDIQNLINEINDEDVTDSNSLHQSAANEQEVSPTPIDNEPIEAEPTSDNIDEELAKLADEMDDSPTIDNDNTPQTSVVDDHSVATDDTETENIAEEEIDDLLSDVTEQINEIRGDISAVTEEPAEPENTTNGETPASVDSTREIIEDHPLPPAQEESETTEPVASAEPAKQPDEFDQALANYNQQQQQQEKIAPPFAGEQRSEPPEIPAGPYADLPFPQRLLVHSLDATNKPFGFVNNEIREMIGLAAVITWLMIMVLAAIILYLI